MYLIIYQGIHHKNSVMYFWNSLERLNIYDKLEIVERFKSKSYSSIQFALGQTLNLIFETLITFVKITKVINLECNPIS